MNKIIGDRFEDHVLQLKQQINPTSNIYLWKNVPWNMMLECGLIDNMDTYRLQRKLTLEQKRQGIQNCDELCSNIMDRGIDILEMKDDNTFVAIQCKCGYKNGLYLKHLSTFYAIISFCKKAMMKEVYHTSKISPFLLDQGNEMNRYIKVEGYNADLTDDLLDENEEEAIENNNVVLLKPAIVEDIVTYIPRDYQIDRIEMLKNYFKTEKRGIMDMPPGTGKTFMSACCANEFKITIMLSPLRQHAYENMERYKQYYPDLKTILVDCDGTRDVLFIKKQIRSFKDSKIMLSSTYKSIDVILRILAQYPDAFVIVDEFHELSRKDIMKDSKDEPTNMYKLLHDKYKILFMSATPRVYDIEDDYENDIYDYDSHIETLLGKTVCSMSFKVAIERKIICDYRIVIPSLTVDNNIEDLMNENTRKTDYVTKNCILPRMTCNVEKLNLTCINDYRKTKSKCDFVMRCINAYGSRKTIVYCKNTEDLMKIKKIINNVVFANEHGINKIWIGIINAKVSDKNRKSRLEQFANNNCISIMLSIQILDQSIDIPSCDSIVITGSFSNKIKTIQRLCRATRKDTNNPSKVAMLYAWCEENDQMLDLLSSMKEYDIDLTEKISIVERQYKKCDQNGICKEIDKVNRFILGIKEYRMNNWYERLEEVKRYIDMYGKRPSTTGKTKTLGQWLSDQQKNYKTKKYIMSNNTIYIVFTKFKKEYSEYFMDRYEMWYMKLNELKNYININKEKPSQKNKYIKLGKWLSHQQENYKTKKDIMGNKEIYLVFTKFKKEYSEYFMDRYEMWYMKLNELKNYINIYGKKPVTRGVNKRLGIWSRAQQKNYKTKKYIMSDKIIYSVYTEFKKEYNEYF